MASENSGKEPTRPSLKQLSASGRRNLLRAAVLAVAVAAALIALLAGDDDGSDSPEPAPGEAAAPRIVSEAELRQAAESLGHAIYWAGRVADARLELRELREGGVQVLYVPEGSAAGGSSNTLTVGTYPLPDPGGALETVAKRPGAITRRAEEGREVVTNEQSPTSVYFASPDNSVQVEVYDPSPARAMSLALSGRIQPVG